MYCDCQKECENLLLLQSDTMKKLVASGCCIFFLQSFPQFAAASDPADFKACGKRTLIKAIAAIVNTEAGRKLPQKRIHLPNLERPQV